MRVLMADAFAAKEYRVPPPHKAYPWTALAMDVELVYALECAPFPARKHAAMISRDEEVEVFVMTPIIMSK